MPDDVRFATTKNCGNGPAMSIPLTCVEFNPFAAGEAVAQAAVNFLEGSEEKYDVASVSRYVIGDTFPEVNFVSKRKDESLQKKNTIESLVFRGYTRVCSAKPLPPLLR